ncbi:unnamed protein product [Boreogadus saida]
MSSKKRSRHRESSTDRKKHKESKDDLEKLKVQTKKLSQEVQKLKHFETFYEKPPPGLIKEREEKPEDCIPESEENEDARNFLASAPTKGLWMPLGKEVKVMQCWRCKRYGHRTGDRECPFFTKGNQKLEQFRVAHEDPMYDLIRENKRNEKESRIQQLQQLLQDSTSSDSDSSSSSSSSSSSKQHHSSKKKKKDKEKKKEKKKKGKADKKPKKKKRRTQSHKSSRTGGSD